MPEYTIGLSTFFNRFCSVLDDDLEIAIMNAKNSLPITTISNA